MLVLSRKIGETIRLGDDIEVTVCQISGQRVRLAISAPREVSIRRRELDYRSPRPDQGSCPHGTSSEFETEPSIDMTPVPSI